MDINEKRKAVYNTLKKADLYSYGIGYVQDIKYTDSAEARAYITWRGTRQYLADFLKYNTPWTGDNQRILGTPDGATSECNPFFIILDDSGEAAFLYWYIRK